MAIMATDNAYWLGKVPDDWAISRIGDYYKLRNEKVSDVDFPPLSVTMKGIVPQLATAAKTDDHDNRKLVRKGDFAINSRSDRRGSCGISDYDGSVSLINTVLTPRGEMNPRYYNWLFHTEQFADEFYKWGHGIVDDLWTTRWQEMKSILIVSPPLAEQQAIADYLDDRCSKIDEIIAEATASIEEYKELKQAVIFEAVTKGLDKNVPMKDSGVEWIGSIPTAWNMTILRRFCSFQTGKTPSTSVPEWFDGDVNWFTPGDFSEKYYLEDSRRKLSQKALDDSAAITVEKDCVMIVGIGGSAGKVGLTKVPCSCNQQITAVMSSVMNPKYLMYYLELDGKYLKETAMFTTLPILNNDTLGNSPLIVPTIIEQKNIADYLDCRLIAINTLIGEKQVLVDDLQTYKKSLIYEVVTGKKRVVV